MKRLFSPWRKPYIEREKTQEQACVFCLALQQTDGPDNLIVHRGQHAFVMLNRFPYTSGHLMTLPNTHLADLEELTPAARAELFELANTAIGVLRGVYAPGGFNLGANLGAAAGAGIAEHLHLHVLPRWNGDTNFISTLGQTRVLPEELEDTWRRVSAAWPQT
ncbi:MAG: HIT domain-containing protein [Anaerolineales bacterium]|nr:HIT domain-containing protein [Anaerolineales bacterium]MCW5854490.1 HIT domain-containing protein [Anaerolineales bacterium]